MTDEKNPYLKRLRLFLGTDVEVTIERRGHEVAVGTVDEVTKDGCRIVRAAPLRTQTFIAKDDICGISTDNWDPMGLEG